MCFNVNWIIEKVYSPSSILTHIFKKVSYNANRVSSLLTYHDCIRQNSKSFLYFLHQSLLIISSLSYPPKPHRRDYAFRIPFSSSKRLVSSCGYLILNKPMNRMEWMLTQSPISLCTLSIGCQYETPIT